MLQGNYGRQRADASHISTGRNQRGAFNAFGLLDFDMESVYRPFFDLFGTRRDEEGGEDSCLVNYFQYGHVGPQDIVYSPKASRVNPAKPDERDICVLRVKKIDLRIKENTKKHYTSEFDITEDLLNPQLVVRRGQKFVIEITFNKHYDDKEDDLRLVFSIGQDPKESKGTQVVFILSAEDEQNKWGAAITQQTGNTLLIDVFTPSDCIVGKWKLNVDVVKRKDIKTAIYRYNHKEPVYIIFNPWCKDDAVYMDNESERREYVLNDKGYIFCGTSDCIGKRPWTFGQFSGNVLDCCMFILDLSGLKTHVRGNSINVVRKLTALINSNDDGGVVVGNWSEKCVGGTSPTTWPGSVPILEQFYEQKKSVKYGQCWVFSGVLTTVCRALGIPARSVTNFDSAHDKDGSITIDIHYDLEGNLKKRSSDSVWNFHVWNEVWMKRPDLSNGYDGWQACDATPQEASDSVYCCGPCPVKAIKLGDVNVPFDGPFIFAEVNGDMVYWQQQPDGTTKPIRRKESAIGKFISTTDFNGDRKDLTHDYKFPEGSAEERDALKKARMIVAPSRNLIKEGIKDVLFNLRNDASNQFVGDDFVVTLSCKNTSSEIRTLQGMLKVRSMYYTGLVADELGLQKLDSVKINPGETKDLLVKVSAKDYEQKLKDGCMMSVSCLAKVAETKQIFVNEKKTRLNKPHLQIKSAHKAKVGEDMEVQVSFINPMSSTLKKCYLEVESPGIICLTKYPQRDILAKETFLTTVKLTPQKPGRKQVIFMFNSALLEDINGTLDIEVLE